MVAFNFQEAGIVFGISLNHRVRIHRVCKQGVFLELCDTAVSHFHLQMLSCLQSSLVENGVVS